MKIELRTIVLFIFAGITFSIRDYIYHVPISILSVILEILSLGIFGIGLIVHTTDNINSEEK